MIVGAGYDGRALRYQAPGVRWWEIDRPQTQDDKRARLARLGVATDHVSFLGLDLAEVGVATALVGNGFEPDAPALFLAEGLVPYLDADTLRSVLGELRSLAVPQRVSCCRCVAQLPIRRRGPASMPVSLRSANLPSDQSPPRTVRCSCPMPLAAGGADRASPIRRVHRGFPGFRTDRI